MCLQRKHNTEDRVCENATAVSRRAVLGGKSSIQDIHYCIIVG